MNAISDILTNQLPNLASGILAILSRVLFAATGTLGTLILALQAVGAFLPLLVHIGIDLYTFITGNIAPQWLMETAKIADFVGFLADSTAGLLSTFAFDGIADRVIFLLKGPVASLTASMIGMIANIGSLSLDHRNEVLQYGTSSDLLTECLDEHLGNC